MEIAKERQDMERVDFYSVTKIIRENYKAGMEPKHGSWGRCEVVPSK